MKINLITPANKQSKSGNRNTAVRWSRLLQKIGHKVLISESYNEKPFDAMIALHAWRSSDSIDRFYKKYPQRPLIVALTGTDIYRFQISHPSICHHSMEIADQLVCLHDLVYKDIPKKYLHKLNVVYQFATPLKTKRSLRKKTFNICVIGHLRMEKDPLRAAYAVRKLPVHSRLYVTHFGKAHDKSWMKKALDEMKHNPRYNWFGEVSFSKIRREYQKTHLMVISSIMEGGANVISEAAVAGVPIVASNIPGNTGLLGTNYPGLYPVKNTIALKKMLLRCEQDPKFLNTLIQHIKISAKKFTLEKERHQWEKILKKLKL